MTKTRCVHAGERPDKWRTVEPLLIDWRTCRLTVDRIVAAEVLYETRNAEPVARFVSQHLAPPDALICDRNRSNR